MLTLVTRKKEYIKKRTTKENKIQEKRKEK